MPKPFMTWTSWQVAYQRLLNWEQRAEALANLSCHDADLPYSKSEIALAVQKWCWQP